MLLFFISIGMIALTVGVHTLAASFWLRYIGFRVKHYHRKTKHPLVLIPILSTSIILIVLHVFEAFIWACLYWQLPAQAGLKSFHEAFYFSVVTFTTVGYGDITLNSYWQVLAGIEGMVGIVVFGLTTAILFGVVQKFWRVVYTVPEFGE